MANDAKSAVVASERVKGVGVPRSTPVAPKKEKPAASKRWRPRRHPARPEEASAAAAVAIQQPQGTPGSHPQALEADRATAGC